MVGMALDEDLTRYQQMNKIRYRAKVTQEPTSLPSSRWSKCPMMSVPTVFNAWLAVWTESLMALF